MRNENDARPAMNASTEHDHLDLDPKLRALAAQLGRLRPREVGLARDRLMFAAGRAADSARPHPTGWYWPVSTVAMTGVAVILSLVLWLGPEPRTVERIVYIGPASTIGDRVAAVEGASRRSTPESERVDPNGLWTAGSWLRLDEGILEIDAPNTNAVVDSRGPVIVPDHGPILSARSFELLLERDG